MTINHWKETKRGKIKPARMPRGERIAYAAEVAIVAAFIVAAVILWP